MEKLNKGDLAKKELKKLSEETEEKELKKLDSGFTFFSFISGNHVIIVGDIKDYLNEQDKIKNHGFTRVTKFKGLKSASEMKVQQAITPSSSIAESNPISKLIFSDYYRPIQISCNKFSMAILLKTISKNEKSNEDFKDFTDLFEDFSSNIKSKNHSFQSYFFNKANNEILFKIDNKHDSASIELEFSTSQSCFIPEEEFNELITDLVTIDKNIPIMKKMIDKFKQVGYMNAGKVDIFQLYRLMYKVQDFFTTKLLVIGDFGKNWYSNFPEGEMKENWKRIYDCTFILELPFTNLPIKQVELGENHILLLTVEGIVYACGDGASGATGNGVRSFHSSPEKVKFPIENQLVKRIAAGGRHSLAILKDNDRLYSWGVGQNGRLGHGNERDQFYPKLIDSLSSAKYGVIDAGDTYSACVTSEGTLYTWGHGEFGRLGHSENTNELIPKKVSYFNQTVTSVKCGYFCTTVYAKKSETAKVEIYTLGAKTTSMMQINERNKSLILIKNENMPVLISENNGNSNYKRIDFSLNQNNNNNNNNNKCKKTPLYAVCGYQYIALITEETHVHTESKIRGEDKEIADENSNYDEDAKSIYSDMNNNNQGANTNIDSNMITKPYTFCDIYIAGNIPMTINNFGTTFSKLVSDDMLMKMVAIEKRTLNNKGLEQYIKSVNGFLSLKSTNKETSDVEIPLKAKTEEKVIKKIICSENNTAVLSSEGNLYAFGSYLYKLCSDQVENYTIPIQPRSIKIIHMALGSNHLIMVTNSFEVFGAGRNTEGQLGIGKPSDTIDISQAQYIEKLRNKGIKKCYASENYTVVLSFTNEGYIFGDVSFLEKSQFIHYQCSPKKLDWGEIYKIACGPSHILMLAKDEKSGLIELKAIGNGTYGKIGDSSENEDNVNIPVDVDLQMLNGYSEEDRKKKVTLRCSRYSSAALLQDPLNNESSKLFIWGLCSRKLFSNPREIEKFDKKKFGVNRQTPIDNTVCITKPVLINPWNEPILKFSMSDTIFYVITHRKELKSMGIFYSITRSTPLLKITGEYKKISLGIDHAVALTANNKLFSWGFNVMNRLGFSNVGNEKDNLTDFNDIMKFFKDVPVNVTNLNKIFEKKKAMANIPAISVPKAENNNIINIETTNLGTGTTSPTANQEQEKKEEITLAVEDSDNIFSQLQTIAKYDYDNLESLMITNELEFKKSLKNILGQYKFLVDNASALQKLKKNLYNQFNFKMVDPPMNIKLKESASMDKLPSDYVKYKRNYKCLLTTLKIHPCYLVKLYEGQYFLTNDKDICPKDLYKIIKGLFANIYDDKYSQYLLIILAKKILEIDINKLLKNCKDENDRKNVLDDYQIYKMNAEGDVEYNLFARICKLIFKTQVQQNYRQELLALQLIGLVYSKTGGKSTPNYESAMLIKYHPSKSKKKSDLNEAYSNLKNQRVDLALSLFDNLIDKFGLADGETKSPLFSNQEREGEKGTTTNKNDKNGKNENNDTTILSKTSKLLIQEIIKTLEKLLKKTETEKINEFIITKFPIIIFHKLLKVMESPKTMLSINAGILIDRLSFQSFMDGSIHNFYSLSYVIKFCLGIFGMGEKANELSDDESNKLIEKKFQGAIKLKLENKMKSMISSFNKSNCIFDLKMLKEFFKHSLNDRSHRINFSLHLLKRLQEVIAPNISKIRVLSPEFDLMDLVFFNKKNYPDNFIGEKGGICNNVNIVDDILVQVNVRSRLLSLQNPSTLMKCIHCSVVTLHEFVLANEAVFFKEFKFLNKSSTQGRFIDILKTCSNVIIKNDKITEFLKEEINKNNSHVNENLYNMFTLLAVDNKRIYQVECAEIADAKQLFDIVLGRDITNTKLKEICKEVLLKYEKMKNQREYHHHLEETLNKIKQLLTCNSDSHLKNINVDMNRNILYEKIKKNFEKGYGNPDIFRNYKNSIKNSSKMIKLENHLNNLPKSKVLMGKLTQEKKEKLLPFRDYDLRRLMEDKIILKTLLSNDEADISPQNFKLLIQKTEKSEFVITLTKKVKIKTNFWACGKSDNLNSKKVHSVLITIDMLKYFTNKAKMKIEKEEDLTAEIEGFMQVNPKEFIKLLKELTSVGLD